jgi:hypothetical protein
MKIKTSLSTILSLQEAALVTFARVLTSKDHGRAIEDTGISMLCLKL